MKESDTYTPHSFLETPEEITFSPVCLDGSKRYRGVACYPKNLYKPLSFSQYADNDIVIYRLLDIPASFAQVIFSEKDVPNDCKAIETAQLEVFSFPKNSRTQGKWFPCDGYKVGVNGFFTMRTDIRFSQDDTNWFSGAPVIQKSSDIIVGMWKSSKGKNSEILGVEMQTILDKLNLITKEGGTQS